MEESLPVMANSSTLNFKKGNRMHITCLTAHGFKGQDFSHNLASVTLFHGPNFRGKSARIEALQLAVAGYIPGAPKKANELYAQFASANPMEVIAELEQHGECVGDLIRRWTQDNGSVSAFSELPANWSFDPVANDATEYLSLSAAERTKFLFKRAKLPEKYKVRNVAQTICMNIKNIKCDPHTEQHETVCDELVDHVGKHTAESVQAWVESLGNSFRAMKLLADANLKRMRQTVQGLAQSSPATIVPVDAEQVYNRAKIVHQTVMEQHSKLTAELTEALKLEQSAVSAKAQLEQVADKQVLLEKVKKQVAEMESGKVPEPSPNLRTVLVKARQELEKAQTTVAELGTRVAMVQRQIQGMKKDHVCTLCGQSTEDIDNLIMAKLLKELKALKEECDDNSHALSLAEKAKESAQSKLDVADKKYRQWNLDYHSATSQKAVCELALAGSLALKEKADRLDELKIAARGKQNAIAALEGSLVKAMNDVVNAEANYKALLAQRAGAASKARATSEAQRAEAEVNVLKQVQKMLSELQGELVQQAVTPFLDKANELCGGIIPYKLEFEDGTIGFRLPNGKLMQCKRPMCSGTQEAIVFCALSIVLATEAPLKLAIIDEVGRLDSNNKLKLVRLLCDLQLKGKIDQAILVDTQSLTPEGTINKPKQRKANPMASKKAEKKSASAKPTTGEKVKIKHQFTLEETNLLVKELTRKMELVEEQDANVKAAAAVAKAEIKSMKADITEMRNKLSGGYEEREVDALVTFHRKSAMKTYTRHCPGQPGHGEFIKKIEMTEGDFQLLPLEEKVGTKVAEASEEKQEPENKPEPATDGGEAA